MGTPVKNDTWVYIIVQNPDGNEQFLGQHDQEKNISFIPFFMEKDEATQCIPLLAREIFEKFETQAILYEDLIELSKENGFHLYLLNGTSEILDKIAPEK